MIEDFGEKIEGAAKDRWRAYRMRLDGVADSAVHTHPLSESFPEPNYTKLLDNGVNPWALAFIRAARDSIPAKPGPRNTRRLGWVRNVTALRQLAKDLLDGNLSAEEVRAAIDGGSKQMSALLDRIKAYQTLGHAVSLKQFDISSNVYRSLAHEAFNPPARRWVIRGTSKKDRFFAHGGTLEEAIGKLGSHLETRGEENSPQKKGPERFILYQRRGVVGVFIGRKIGKNTVDLFHFDTQKQARDFRRDHPDQLTDRFEQLKRMPPERGAENAERTGTDHRGGRNISPGEFSATFGFRGVQFGNYVEGPRRQQDLNNAFDALMDLSSVLGCAPSALSLDGQLGLAFGARGSGGRNAGAAHYEPLQVVINLTKGNGAGSLAHEWFHALDNLVGRRMGAVTYFGTGLRQGCSASLTFEDRAAVEALSRLGADLRAAPVRARSVTADRYRSSPYFSLSHEIGARSFETWVISRLDQMGGRNDYLANVLPEEVFDAEARLLGLPDSRYPYPRKSEMAGIASSFEACFDKDGAIAEYLGGLAAEAAVPAPEEPSSAERPHDPYEFTDEEEISFG